MRGASRPSRKSNKIPSSTAPHAATSAHPSLFRLRVLLASESTDAGLASLVSLGSAESCLGAEMYWTLPLCLGNRPTSIRLYPARFNRIEIPSEPTTRDAATSALVVRISTSLLVGAAASVLQSAVRYTFSTAPIMEVLAIGPFRLTIAARHNLSISCCWWRFSTCLGRLLKLRNVQSK